ncbi:hypothetical protein [Pseudarthrobacter sp. NS4]|uniref:hypothetical protein n=1 Tax=Pseudarthrobacter sp. NS4 TaxID=2973976 RepID=UPI002163968C|nr:hypothetical protein [Pseudarthrobacter sp. NS4]
MNTTKYPATFREFAETAIELGMTLPRLLEVLGPIPMPPAGYTLAPKSESRWIGTETIARGYIITPTWDYRTQKHSIEVWMAEHEAPDYAVLSPAEALRFAADLTAAVQAVAAHEAPEV